MRLGGNGREGCELRFDEGAFAELPAPVLIDSQHFGAVGRRELFRPPEEVPKVRTFAVRKLGPKLRGELKSVTIYKLENETFFAHLNIEQKSADGNTDQVLRVDTRPSDGVAIACRVAAPILAAESVMDAASQDLSILASADDEEEDDDEEFDD